MLKKEERFLRASERDRIEREFQTAGWDGIIFPETARSSEELRAQARQRLVSAWRSDIANDNDAYSNFDNERARTLERFDTLPKTMVENARGEETDAPAVIAFLQELKNQRIEEFSKTREELEKKELKKSEQNEGGIKELVQYVQDLISITERDYITHRERILAQTSILSPAEITHDIMNEEFRRAVMRRLFDAFTQNYEKYERQLASVSRARDETYAPYRILEDAEIDEVRERIRQGPAIRKLVDAFLRGGEPAIKIEEEALQKQNIGIFTQEELARLRPEIERRASQQ